MKVLILADRPGWIVDRIVNRMIEGIPCEFTKEFYTRVDSAELIALAAEHDLVHYGNWDLSLARRSRSRKRKRIRKQGYDDPYMEFVELVIEKAPLLYSIRSHRYRPYVLAVAKKVTRVHVISPLLLEEFPHAAYIPDGVFERFHSKKAFVVGWAGHPTHYKGVHLLEEACKQLGVELRLATGRIPPEDMPDWYRDLDLYVCASVAEGYSAPVMECLAMNVPVITTDVGVPSTLNVMKIPRSVEGIKEGIERFYTQKQVLPEFSWEVVNRRFYSLYQSMVEERHATRDRADEPL